MGGDQALVVDGVAVARHAGGAVEEHACRIGVAGDFAEDGLALVAVEAVPQLGLQEQAT